MRLYWGGGRGGQRVRVTGLGAFPGGDGDLVVAAGGGPELVAPAKVRILLRVLAGTPAFACRWSCGGGVVLRANVSRESALCGAGPQRVEIENDDPPAVGLDPTQLAERLQRVRRARSRGPGPGGDVLL